MDWDNRGVYTHTAGEREQSQSVVFTNNLIALKLRNIPVFYTAYIPFQHDKGFDYDGKENGGESDVGKGQHHKILFQEPKKYLLLTRDHIREATAYGAGGGYSLQIQVAVPLQTPYSSKRGGSGGYEGSASGDSEVPIPLSV
ncbi:hypothetical protein DAPPUDRAFT_112807 [Daphnia pulex]|uniref:Uncharacterized protein n=1 Tax=Daphnia pulex TaxID=6669 RepID=E9HD41_DAPPU|nr:hypothetical protein DAPPUDRAFT_112807 [Daphnia pulex]|eukprot:EFX70302.1 hypothetical protein DAPPUDRAFT_112807 [Daphnia pulex]